MHDFLSHLQWRNATKDFDPDQKVPQEELKKILGAIHFAPSSYGLQPYHVKVIAHQTLKNSLLPHSLDQSQIVNCSHLLVFCVRTDANDRIEKYLETASSGNPEIKEKLAGYGQIMRDSVGKFSEEKLLCWAQKQAYIALGFAMAACAEEEVDSCPIEGFDPEKYDEILNLPAYLKSTVLLPIGYRKSDPNRPKVRFSDEDLFSFE